MRAGNGESLYVTSGEEERRSGEGADTASSTDLGKLVVNLHDRVEVAYDQVALVEN